MQLLGSITLKPTPSGVKQQKNPIVLVYQGANNSFPAPPTNAPRKPPFARILQETLAPVWPPLPIQELIAATTAATSSRGTRIQSIFSPGGMVSIFRISIDIDVPDTPSNWERAEVMYVRAVSSSRGVDDVRFG